LFYLIKYLNFSSSSTSEPRAQSASSFVSSASEAIAEQFEIFNLDVSDDSDSEPSLKFHKHKNPINSEVTGQQSARPSFNFVRAPGSKAIDVWTFIEKDETAQVNRCRFCM
jgi:hypothetical protein